MVRFVLFAYLLCTSAFAYRVQQFDTIGIRYAQKGWGSQKLLRPITAHSELTKQSCASRQMGEQRLPITLEAAIKRPIADAFERKQKGQGDNFAWPKPWPGMFGDITHLIIDVIEQICDKILSSHRAHSFVEAEEIVIGVSSILLFSN
jgi:hypothetical protein